MMKARLQMLAAALSVVSVMGTQNAAHAGTKLVPGRVAVLPVSMPATLHLTPAEVSALFSGELVEKGARVQSAATVREILLNQDVELDLMLEEGRNMAIGHAVGAQYLFRATILEYREFEVFAHDGKFGLSAELVDARTGEIVWSGSETKIIYWVEESQPAVFHLKQLIDRLMRDLSFSQRPGRD